jgi:hypothetical protein
MAWQAWRQRLQARPPLVVRSGEQTDDDFLTLDEPAPMARPPLASGDDAGWTANALADDLAANWAELCDAPFLERASHHEGLVLAWAIPHAPLPPPPPHAAVVRLLERAVVDPDPVLAVAAVRALAHLRAAEAQLAVAESLAQGPARLGHDGVQACLDFLDTHGDGRCVRTLEALLHERGFELSESHAWRTRHIVQAIRRARRR